MAARIIVVLCLSFCTFVLSSLFHAVSELNQVSNHTEPFVKFTVPSITHCSMACERRLQKGCKAFNVQPNLTKGGWSCELLHNRSHKMPGPDMVNVTNGRYFERICDGLSLITAGKDIINGQVIMTMVDVQQDVYQQRSGTNPLFIGTVSHVFEGLGGELEDLLSVYMHPWNRTHLIRSGRMVYCFVGDDDLLKFKQCESTFFPLDYSVMLNNPKVSSCLYYVIGYDLYKIVQLWSGVTMVIATQSEEGLRSGDLITKLSDRTEFKVNCKDDTRDGYNVTLCEKAWQWMKASGGVFLSLNRVCFFVNTTGYILDFDKTAMVEHHPICRDEINSFFM